MPNSDIPCRARDRAVERSIHSYNKRRDASSRDQRASDRECGRERRSRIADVIMLEQLDEMGHAA